MVTKETNDKIEREVEDLLEKIISMIGIEAKAKATVGDEVININIDGEDLGLLIGYRGETIESLQLLLGIILNKKYFEGSWRPILVDVGGWRAAREESLRILVEQKIACLSADRNFVELPPMPPAQRRAVHILVGEREGLESESMGEEPNRYVVIKKVGRD